jgi:hypothetical protein
MKIKLFPLRLNELLDFVADSTSPIPKIFARDETKCQPGDRSRYHAQNKFTRSRAVKG